MTLAILGIDSGIKGAWALFHERHARPWAFGAWKGLELGSLDQAHDIAISIECALRSPRPVSQVELRALTGLRIVYERPAGKVRTNGHVTFRPAHWLCGLLRARLDGWLPIEPVEIMPSEWQGTFGIGGHAGRKERKAEAVQMCRLLWQMDVGEDQADALLMAEHVRRGIPMERRGK